MKHVRMTYSNGETELWYIPISQTIGEAIAEIEAELCTEVTDIHVERWQ